MEGYTREDLYYAACEQLACGMFFGAAGGWGLHAAWTGDWTATVLAVVAAVAYVLYRQWRRSNHHES